MVIYDKRLKINSFLKKNKIITYSGKKYILLNLKAFDTGLKINRYVFTKKPFSGPIKKFKAFGKI